MIVIPVLHRMKTHFEEIDVVDGKDMGKLVVEEYGQKFFVFAPKVKIDGQHLLYGRRKILQPAGKERKEDI